MERPTRQTRYWKTVRDAPELSWPDAQLEFLPLANLLKDMGFCSSTSEARRAVQQGGVTLDGVVATDPMVLLRRADLPILLQVGKRRAARVMPPKPA